MSTRWLSVLACFISTSAWAQTIETSTPTALGDHEVLIETLQLRLDQLAERVDLVADKVDLLQDTALGSDVSETRAILVHNNDLGGAFRLERAKYILDGEVLMDRVDSEGTLDSIKELTLYEGKMRPGEHLLEVEMICRSGGFGFFSYVDAYRFKISSKYKLMVRDGRINRVDAVVSLNPDITLKPEKRLRITYGFSVVERRRDNVPVQE